MKSLLKNSLLSVATLAALGASGGASAQVRYDFTAFSSIPIDGESFSGSFSAVLPDFVTLATTVAVEALLNCTVVVSPAGPAECREQRFRFNSSPASVTISFGVSTNLGETAVFYFFDAAAFSTLGTHDTVIFGDRQAGRLVVTAVPEPGQWAMLTLGLAAVGAAVRRQRQVNA